MGLCRTVSCKINLSLLYNKVYSPAITALDPTSPRPHWRSSFSSPIQLHFNQWWPEKISSASSFASRIRFTNSSMLSYLLFALKMSLFSAKCCSLKRPIHLQFSRPQDSCHVHISPIQIIGWEDSSAQSLHSFAIQAAKKNNRDMFVASLKCQSPRIKENI